MSRLTYLPEPAAETDAGAVVPAADVWILHLPAATLRIADPGNMRVLDFKKELAAQLAALVDSVKAQITAWVDEATAEMQQAGRLR